MSYAKVFVSYDRFLTTYLDAEASNSAFLVRYISKMTDYSSIITINGRFLVSYAGFLTMYLDAEASNRMFFATHLSEKAKYISFIEMNGGWAATNRRFFKGYRRFLGILGCLEGKFRGYSDKIWVFCGKGLSLWAVKIIKWEIQ